MTTKKTRRTPELKQQDATEAFETAGGAVPRPQLSFDRFRKSDRLQAFLTGSTKSTGYSCNVFSVGDSVASIGEAASWSLEVSAYQGAPSVDLSALRPRNSAVSTGGNSSGAAAFSRVFDSIVGSMRRPTKKNGAGIVWLSCFHPDLQEFLDTDFTAAFKGIYIPADSNRDDVIKLLANKTLMKELAAAYEEGKCFICKLPDVGLNGEPLKLNLCTEVEIPHRGGCTLGVINISQFTLDTIHELADVMSEASLAMENDLNQVLQALPSTPLFCNSPNNTQFGLGVSGLASLLANCGVSYENFTVALENAVEDTTKIYQVFDNAIRRLDVDPTPAAKLVAGIAKAYEQSTIALGNRVLKAFCVQPSATGAYQCADSSGYYSSPELQPVIGIRDSAGVHTIRKSQLLGDEKVVFHPATETINDVPYAVYARLCSAWQHLLDTTGLAHRHSACYYGDRFTPAKLEAFVESRQKSLYYRLPSYNEVALDKTQVGEGLACSFDIEDLETGCDCAG